MKSNHRTESDSLGSIKVEVSALYSAQTQRALDNFSISSLRMPESFIKALIHIKEAAAIANQKLGLLDGARGQAIQQACREIVANFDAKDFPVDVFQTGSGTSSNMNVNEVIAHVANNKLALQRQQELGKSQVDGPIIHPNDHVNMSQSSNDVVPSGIHLSAALQIENNLRPALLALVESINQKIAEQGRTIKTGRTHLMDAMPLTVGQELSGWAAQL